MCGWEHSYWHDLGTVSPYMRLYIKYESVRFWTSGSCDHGLCGTVMCKSLHSLSPSLWQEDTLVLFMWVCVFRLQSLILSVACALQTCWCGSWATQWKCREAHTTSTFHFPFHLTNSFITPHHLLLHYVDKMPPLLMLKFQESNRTLSKLIPGFNQYQSFDAWCMLHLFGLYLTLSMWL